ncbi:hypothetical protein CK203_021122 [Vitis vinifera]|uniref:Uncharacterized protein n=1 Tax=Vitis vinifera TaxID=29760 RepID=A0A438JWI9_VITVI|nr:hypothetical protein CK203_021122 [Vitis vinifera]
MESVGGLFCTSWSSSMVAPPMLHNQSMVSSRQRLHHQYPPEATSAALPTTLLFH